MIDETSGRAKIVHRGDAEIIVILFLALLVSILMYILPRYAELVRAEQNRQIKTEEATTKNRFGDSFEVYGTKEEMYTGHKVN